MTASALLAEFIAPVAQACAAAPALDLACGTGRNGLYLLEHNIDVVFADRNAASLASVQDSLFAAYGSGWGERATTWEVDFERPGTSVLPEATYGAIVVFRYLHRPLLPAIVKALKPGGLLVYETFTVAQREYGRPKNPDFLLRERELPEYFKAWEILHEFEGTVCAENSEQLSALARLVARNLQAP